MPSSSPGLPCGGLQGRARGFSLVEIMVVLGLLALAGSVAITPMLDWRHGMRLHAAANEVRADLTLARVRAVKENTSVTVEFYPASGRYQVTYTDPAGNGVLVKSHALPPGVKIAAGDPTHTLDSCDNRAVFTARGTAVSATLVLANARGATRQIVINYLGRVDVRN